jgi:hypothetical protein
MDIKVEVKFTGLEPLVEAINLLAKGYGASNAAVDQVVNKAKGQTKQKAAEPVVKPETESGEVGIAAAEQAGEVEKSADTATAQGSSTETQTSANAGTAAEETVDAGKSAQPASETESSSPSTTNASDASATSASITDEVLRAAAAAKARVNKEKTKAIVNKFAESVTQIPADQRAAFLAELEEVAA